MDKDDILYALAYQQLTFNIPQVAAELYLAAGTVKEVYANRKDIRAVIPEATDHLQNILKSDWANELIWAEREIKWCREKSIQALCMEAPKYPQRLKNCIDAPVVVYYRGTVDLNSQHIISIVGTRKSTPYGNDAVHKLIMDLKKMVPDTIVISGLAYGIDVAAHKEALTAGMSTIGVLAHGLDTMYPAVHRNIAIKMLSQGGLLTEYPSLTRGDRQNFLRRNRIVAGLSDCTIVAESMAHGGSLVTARIANDYNKDVFAIPGRIGDPASEGCNDLIKNNKASLLSSAKDIVEALGWTTVEQKEAAARHGFQTELFPNLNDDQKAIVAALADEDLQTNLIAMRSGLHISAVNAALFELEMSGIVKAYAGGTYHLIK